VLIPRYVTEYQETGHIQVVKAISPNPVAIINELFPLQCSRYPPSIPKFHRGSIVASFQYHPIVNGSPFRVGTILRKMIGSFIIPEELIRITERHSGFSFSPGIETAIGFYTFCIQIAARPFYGQAQINGINNRLRLFTRRKTDNSGKENNSNSSQINLYL